MLVQRYFLLKSSLNDFRPINTILLENQTLSLIVCTSVRVTCFVFQCNVIHTSSLLYKSVVYEWCDISDECAIGFALSMKILIRCAILEPCLQ